MCILTNVLIKHTKTYAISVVQANFTFIYIWPKCACQPNKLSSCLYSQVQNLCKPDHCLNQILMSNDSLPQKVAEPLVRFYIVHHFLTELFQDNSRNHLFKPSHIIKDDKPDCNITNNYHVISIAYVMYLMKSPKYIGGLIVSTNSSPISSPMTRRIHLSNQTPSSRLTNLSFISSLVERWKLKFVLKWNTVYSFEFAQSYIHTMSIL